MKGSLDRRTGDGICVSVVKRKKRRSKRSSVTETKSFHVILAETAVSVGGWVGWGVCGGVNGLPPLDGLLSFRGGDAWTGECRGAATEWDSSHRACGEAAAPSVA